MWNVPTYKQTISLGSCHPNVKFERTGLNKWVVSTNEIL